MKAERSAALDNAAMLGELRRSQVPVILNGESLVMALAADWRLEQAYERLGTCEQEVQRCHNTILASASNRQSILQ